MNKLQVFYPVEGELVPVSFVILGRTEPGRVVTAGTVSAVAGQDGIFSLPFHAENPFYDLTLTDGVSEQRLRFVCDTDPRKRYNFFIDDNVFFLTEIARKQYKSVFESFYLDFLRTLHRKYGFKVTLNMFYDNAHDPEHFNTSELDTRYRSEFEDNADWLRLAFHAYSEFPGAPYGKVYPEKLPEHHRIVTDEIRRFAGEKTLIEPVLLHFHDIASDASRKYIADAGMRCFTPSMERHWLPLFEKLGRKITAQYNYQFNQLELQLLFMVNLYPEEKLLAMLEDAYREQDRNFLLVGTHEQYSYPFYSNYIPEHFQRMESVVRSLTDHGYESVYFTETLLK